MDKLAASSKEFLHKTYSGDTPPLDSDISSFLGRDCEIVAREIPVELQWVNSQPLSIHETLRGRYVLLDFFTYCCINCMHILPTLHQLEQDTADQGLVVVGVHSGKFSNEKSEGNIRDAVARYNISHPVVNDSQYDLWNTYQIICWPTLILINPEGKVVLVSIGESDVHMVVRFVKDALRLSPPTSETPLPAPLLGPAADKEEGSKSKNVLRYPGKVLYHPESNSVFISDTANNRIVQVNCLGEIVSQFPPSLHHESHVTSDDSHVTTAGHMTSLCSPQGLAVYRNKLIVCDTFNHRIVGIELDSRGVMRDDTGGQVLVGTGKQGNDLEGGKTGVEQEISSPWDVVVIVLDEVCEGCHGDMLFVAMAGTHQIWACSLSDVTITHRGKVSVHEEGCVWRVAGNGEEANRNNSYPHKSSFAQPSGMTYNGVRTLYIADSESSTVRSMEIPDFTVKNVAGGGFDPTDLFAYGDQDGKGTAAKFQHPVGIQCTGPSTLLVADTYNHKIRIIDTKSRVVSTLQSVTGLLEPSGLSYDSCSGTLYISDTNNHRIIVCQDTLDHSSGVNITGMTWSPLEISDRGIRSAKLTRSSRGFASGQEEKGVEVRVLPIQLEFRNKLNSSASSHIKILSRKLGTGPADTSFTDTSFSDSDIPVTGKLVEIPLCGRERSIDLLITVSMQTQIYHDIRNSDMFKCMLVHPFIKVQTYLP